MDQKHESDGPKRKATSSIKHKIVVLSGKGGVGKSTVSVNLAVSLSEMGYKTGLIDIDFHGPSVPKMLGIESEKIMTDKEGNLIPVKRGDNLRVLSIGFINGDPDAAVIWRAPIKIGVIKQFLEETAWGELDFLVIDSPPGTGDEPLSVIQLLENPDGAVIVTTPQEISLSDVRKSVNFAKKMNLGVIGVIENMSGFTCPHCGEVSDIFKSGGGENMAEQMGVPFIGKIPISQDIVILSDSGVSVSESKENNSSKIYKDIADKIVSSIIS